MLRLLVHQPLSCSNRDLHRWVVQQEKSSCSRHFFPWSTVCWKSIRRYFLAVNIKLFIRQHLASSMTIFTLVKGWNLTALAFNLLGALPHKVRDRKRFTKKRPRRWSPYQQGHITLNFHLQVLRNHKSETCLRLGDSTNAKLQLSRAFAGKRPCRYRVNVKQAA